MGNSFDKLPYELWIEILSLLQKKDLKQARLSCCRLRDAGDHLLFRRLYFAPRNETMDAFQHITANPAFCRHITEVIYDGRLFHQKFLKPQNYYKAYKTYVQELPEERRDAILADCKRAEKEVKRTKNDIRVTGSKLTDREQIALEAVLERTYNGKVEKSMKKYVQFYIEQEKILENGRDKDVLFTGMKKMPHIYRLSIIDQFGKSDDWSSVEYSWYNKMATRSFGCSLTPTQWPKRYLISPDGVTVEDARLFDRPWDCRGIVNILQAAAMHNPRIEDFELGSERSNAPIGIFSNNPTTVLNIVRGLRSLSLYLDSLSTSAEIDHNPTPEETSFLMTMLQQANSLSSLAADLDLTPSQYRDVFSGLDSSHLTSLHLNRLLYPEPNCLVGLLERHRASLRDLRISEAYITPEQGTWRDVAHRLGQFLELRYLGLRDMIDTSEFEDDDYLPGGYFMLAMLIIPSFSPEDYTTNMGTDFVEVRQMGTGPDHWYFAPS